MAVSDDVLEQVRDKYPQYAWMFTLPYVGDVIRRALAEQWSPERLAAEVQASPYWRVTSDASRKWEALWATDPRTAQERWSATSLQVGQQAAQLGVEIPWSKITEVAWNAQKFGWNELDIRNALSTEFRIGGGKSVGVAANLRAVAAEYLVPMSDQTLQQWGQQIVSGQQNEQTFRSYLIEQAKSLFPSLSSALDRGVTVAQYVEPYRQLAARELEVAPEQVDFTQPKWNRALFRVDAQTGERTSLSLSEWQTEIRSNDTYGWDRTGAARSQAAEMGSELLRKFGAL